MALGTLWSITLDCTDPKALATFWREALGAEIAYESENFVGVKLPNELWIGCYKVDDYTAPEWSADASTKQFHLDISVDDLDKAERKAVELGATTAEHQPQRDRWRVLFDPAGHPFCVTNQQTG